MKKLLIRVTLVIVTLVAMLNFTAQAQTFVWLLNGNTTTSADVNFLGTLDNQALVLRTFNTERVRILASGNTGIGTNNPLQKLDVNGNINIGTGSSLFMENYRVLKSEAATGSIFLGINAGSQNTGYYNTANGTYAFTLNTNGSYNTVSGGYASYFNTSGSYNTATGYAALYSNGTGSYNSADGGWALYGNTSGNYNTAMGHGALYSNGLGNFNTAVGFSALYNTSGSSSNTALGDRAGASYANGWNNTFLGAGADAGNTNLYNTIAIGNFSRVYAPSQVRIGNSSNTSIGGYANWTNISDGRVKKNIKENVPGLSFVNKLKPVTYNLDLDAADKITRFSAKKDQDGKMMAPEQFETDARNAKEQISYTGFVAQDVEKTAKELNYDFSGVDAAKNDQDLYGLRYAEFVVPLVKAVQELSAQNDELKSRMERMEALLSQNKTPLPSPNASLTGGFLEQNTPNPFEKSTNIRYTLPPHFSAAQIVITDNNGKTVKQVTVSGSGKGVITLDTFALSSGTYQYTLVVDGKRMDSKQMILVK
jgi:trimeric autotransporter adhesin